MTPLLLVRKELRALLPWWAASAGVLLLLWLVRDVEIGRMLIRGEADVAGIWTYIVGAVVLGAMALGHEYTHNTLSALLAQPIGRLRLLLVKASSLAVLLAGLGAVATMTLNINPFGAGPRVTTLFWLPPICAICLTPWLTMISRSPLGGAVYSFLVPILMGAAGAYLGVPPSAAPLIIAVMAGLALALTACTFVRLQVTGTAQTEVDLLGWMRSARQTQVTSPRRHVVSALVMKELRLQQVTFVVGVAYVVGWVAIGATAPWGRETFVDNLQYAATIIFAGLVSLLPGALVSAEERSYGTADWHTLLPTTRGLQWGLKVGVAVALAVGLAVGLPRLLDALSPSTALEEAFHPALALMLCLSAIYVSSLSRNGLHALLATVPAIALASVAFLATLLLTYWLATPYAESLKAGVLPLTGFSRANPELWSQFRMWVPFTSIGALLVCFAARNHRTTERSRSRIGRQAAWIVAVAWGSALTLFLVDVSRGMTPR